VGDVAHIVAAFWTGADDVAVSKELFKAVAIQLLDLLFLHEAFGMDCAEHLLCNRQCLLLRQTRLE
jgi:hypothetical protein